jgi:hypothetical protein
VGKNKGVWLLGIYLFLAIYLLPMFPHGGSANEMTRWATAASLVENGSFEMSWTQPLIGPNVDTARIDNRTYSNKAPGVAILAAPFYAITRLIVGPPDASNIRVSWFVMRFALSSLPLLLLGVWLYRKGADEFSLATLLFATPLFVYSLLLFSHVLAGVLLYVAFRLIYDGELVATRKCFFAGLLCGLAVVSEFPVAIPVIVLGLGILFAKGTTRPAAIASFIAGGAPSLIFLLIYNASLFGSPLSMSYAHESFPEWAAVANQGAFGIGFPTLSNSILLLISPSRGLFFTAPVLALTVISFVMSPDRSSLRHRVKVATVIVAIVAMCGHAAAHGGWAFGPRYLVMIMPLMLDSFFIRHEDDAGTELWRELLFAVSLVFCVVPILTFPFAPPEFNAPHNDFWTPFLVQEKWVVPNLSNVVGLSPSIANLAPVFVAIGGVFWIVVTSRTRSKYSIAGMMIGLAAASMWMFVPGRESQEDIFRRATIAERYFNPAGRLEIYRRSAVNSRDWAGLRRVTDAEWNIADVRAYAPDDFPYLSERVLQPSPREIVARAVGGNHDAEALLADGKKRFPFAACDFATNLAVIHYASGRKDQAIAELESVQTLIDPASRPECVRGQYLLGTLYEETGRHDDAEKVFRAFLQTSSNTADPELLRFRQQLQQRGVK